MNFTPNTVTVATLALFVALIAATFKPAQAQYVSGLDHWPDKWPIKTSIQKLQSLKDSQDPAESKTKLWFSGMDEQVN
ncbi:MAG: hypothetical protein AAGF54_18290 [Pseudomonadota bacterium]